MIGAQQKSLTLFKTRGHVSAFLFVMQLHGSPG